MNSMYRSVENKLKIIQYNMTGYELQYNMLVGIINILYSKTAEVVLAIIND